MLEESERQRNEDILRIKELQEHNQSLELQIDKLKVCCDLNFSYNTMNVDNKS